MTKKTFYITTAIDYVNARPHSGHAFEKTLADAIARYKRLRGYDVFFLTGVDENAQKNVEVAKKLNIPTKQFVDRNTAFFIELCKKLNLSHDDFIRTSANEHAIVVTKVVQKMIKNKDIYKGIYKGLYCVGCEAYYTEKDLIDGKCPEHNKEPELREEEAYFFKLSKYQKELEKLIPKYVIPNERANEVLTRVKEGLNDICISRKNVEWGIPFPNDKEYKIWVWIDALINYISGLKDKEKKYWPAQVHVIGKGINWFHSVIWPSLLLSSKYKLSEKLLVHGYLNIGGKKMSKSIGNTIDPLELLNKYPSDVVRYSLLKCSVFDDSDYSEEILIERNNNELADKLGNLISRVASLIERNGLQKTSNKLLKNLNLKDIEKSLENYQFDKALSEIFSFIDVCNGYVQEKELWKSGDKKVLYELADSIKAISILLWPFIPESCEKIALQFSFKIGVDSFKEIKKPLKISKIKKGEILFRKIEVKEVEKEIIKTSNTFKIEGLIKMNEIEFSEWQKIDLRVGTIIHIESIEGADKLYKLTVDIGEKKIIICAGLKKFYTEEQLQGKQCIVFVNLKPRMMKGIESQGMLLAAVNDDESSVILLSPEKKIENGSKIR